MGRSGPFRVSAVVALLILVLVGALPPALASAHPSGAAGGGWGVGGERPSPAIVRPSGSGEPTAAPTTGPVDDRPGLLPADPDRVVSARPSGSPSPSVVPAGPLVTDTISISASVCAGVESAPRVVFTRNPALADPAPGCRPAAAGQLALLVADPADHDRVYDRVVIGSGGYAIAVVPVGQPFVLIVGGDESAPAAGAMSPVYRLPADRARRRPISLRLFRIDAAITTGTPAPGTGATPVPDAGRATPGAGTPVAGPGIRPITLLGMVCASDNLAGTYAYRPGLDEETLPDASGTCRRATAGEMEFLLLDNTEANRLYDDALSGPDGIAIAWAPVDRTFFVSEFQDDPNPDTGLASGSQAILIPSGDSASGDDDQPPVALTVIRYVSPGAAGLTVGTLFLSTVACPSGGADPVLSVLGPDPAILLLPPGTAPGTPQPGSGRGCVEAAADYEVMPYDASDPGPIDLADGADDGALIARLPATITADGIRAFAPYTLTEQATGATVTFDVQEGRYTSVRVVLVDTPGTPVASDATGSSRSSPVSAGPGTPASSPGPGTPDPTGTPPDPAATPETDTGGGLGLGLSPIRLLWAVLALLGIAVFLAGVLVLRRPAGRAARR